MPRLHWTRRDLTHEERGNDWNPRTKCYQLCDGPEEAEGFRNYGPYEGAWHNYSYKTHFFVAIFYVGVFYASSSVRGEHPAKQAVEMNYINYINGKPSV